MFEVVTRDALPNGIYQFFLLLFDPNLGISPPFPVDVTVTVASPGEFYMMRKGIVG